MGQSIREWLDDDAGSIWELVDWLRGYGLPLSSGNDEPYLWLMRGLEEIGMAKLKGGRFCERFGLMLDKMPEIALECERPEEVLYNVFRLAVCLHCPSCLGKPLLKIYSQGKIQGDWMRIDLRSVLRAALIENQINQDLRPVWASLFEEESKRLLPGKPLDGFTGICKMPRSENELGVPDVEAILGGLTKMVAYLKDKPDRVKNLFALFFGLKEEYPAVNWASKWSYQSRRDNWMPWASGIAGFLNQEKRPAARSTDPIAAPTDAATDAVAIYTLPHAGVSVEQKTKPAQRPTGNNPLRGLVLLSGG